MNPQPHRPLRISFRPTSSLAFLVGFSALAVSAYANGPVPGQPPGEQPAMPNAPLPSRPSEDFKDHSPAAPAEPSAASQRVLVEVAQLSAETTRLSQIATDRASHAAVRDFAGEVSHSSQALTDEIDRMAAARNIAVRPAPAAAEDEEWQEKNANRLDEAYLQRTRVLHEGAIAALEAYLGDRQADPEIAVVAKRHLPGLREHLHEAEHLDERVSHAPSRHGDEEEAIAQAWPGHNRPGNRPVILALGDENPE